ncbi:RtcB family protein [Candidatus Pacearchaeota archaeon]|nr:RtcB family protein [Candidatus Pacearchaeota archaeon]
MKATLQKQDDIVPAKLWVDPAELESQCHNQLHNLRVLPFAVQHIAVMPDAHCGYGMPIGCVLATDNVVIPNAVGVDIGCGMIAVRLKDLPGVDEVRSGLQHLQYLIQEAVPVGRNWHEKMCGHDDMPTGMQSCLIVGKQYDRARHQLGTLGGGNHFIEVQVDAEGDIWVMIHSGSRNLGKQVADHYAKWALDDNAMHFSSVPRSADLGFFRRGHDGFDEYIQEMNYCIEFAKKNREAMMWAVVKAFHEIWPETMVAGQHWFDICHNHMSIENHFGRNVCVHRKGAAGPYRNGVWGIIPGSMGSKSYIVSHTGEKLSYLSTSHGAGRRMSRRRAKEELDLEAEQKHLDELGVVHSLRGRGNLDEAPSAYKSIAEVMANQVDLCNIEVVLTPILSIKG